MHQSLVLQNVRVFDSSAATLKPGTWDVAVSDGQIQFVEPHGSGRPYPHGATVHDGTGKYLIPGLIDAHVHITATFTMIPSVDQLFWGMSQIRRNCETALHTGFTTVRDMMSPLNLIHQLQNEIRTGKLAGPRIHSPGPFLTPPDGYPYFLPKLNSALESYTGKLRWFISTTKEAEYAVNWLAEHGVSHVKIPITHRTYTNEATPVPHFEDSIVRTIYRTAHRHDLKVACHQTWIHGLREAIRLPVDTIEHLTIDELVTSKDVKDLVAKGVPVTPTMKAARDMALDDPLRHPRILGSLLDTPMAKRVFHSQAIRNLRHLLKDRWAPEFTRIESREMAKMAYDNAPENLRRLYEGGVTIGVGTDAGVPICFFSHLRQELELLVGAGMPPAEVLRAATWTNAGTLGIQDQVGAVTPGRQADLVVLGADPTSDITNVYRMEHIIKGGTRYEPWVIPGDPHST